MTPHEGQVYCDLHGCIHDVSNNPYDHPSGKDEQGRDIFLEYVDLDEHGAEITSHRSFGGPKVDKTTKRESDPECGPINWRKLWIGGPVGEDVKSQVRHLAGVES